MFLVVGAQKCATSWLYLCLRDHPDLHLPDRKREVEYLGGARHRELGDDWYRELVSRPGAPEPDARCGDVSVEYLWDPRAPSEVARLFPGARVVASLRHPVERAVSAWAWYQRKGLLPAGTGLAQALEAGRRWLVETDAGARSDALPRPGTPEELVARGCYDVQLRRWLRESAAEELLVLDYAEIRDRPEAALGRVWDFLGVPPHEPASLEARPKRNTYAPLLQRLERLAPDNRGWAFLLDRLQRHWPGGAPSPVEGLPPELLAGLDEAFRPGQERLRALLDGLPGGRRPAEPSFLGPAGGVG